MNEIKNFDECVCKNIEKKYTVKKKGMNEK